MDTTAATTTLRARMPPSASGLAVDTTPGAVPDWLTNMRERSKRWDKRHAAAARRRLNDECERLRADAAQAELEIARVEKQLYLLDDDDGGGSGGGRHGSSGSSSGATAAAAAAAGNTNCSHHLLWIISGVVNGILKLIFCIVFASLIADAAPHLLKDKIPILVGTQLASTLVTCLFTARYSTVGASIAGPDIIHALVLKTMTTTVATMTTDPDVALATVLFLICFTSLCISLTWLVVARYRLMVIIDFFPISVVTGFLGCIGYKVLKEAIHIAVGGYWYDPSGVGFWRLLLPALPVGLPMYLLKRFHIGDPKLTIPFYMFVPLIVFFISVAASGKSLSQVRLDGWLPEEAGQGRFYDQWLMLDFSKVHGAAVLATLPDTVVLTIVITLDAFLKLSSTKTGLRTKMDMVQELYVLGYQNLLSTLCVGSVGYSQVKFNMINFAIIKDAQERRPTIVVALLCGSIWFIGYPLLNVLPRFFLAGLLIYAGLPFTELVIVAYQRVTKKEFFTIWLIILINAITGLKNVTGSLATHSLLIAVCSGFVLSAAGFIYQYARITVIRDVVSGQDFQSAVVRPYAEQRLVERLGKRYMVIELEGYIFFGSATQIVTLARRLAERNLKLPAEGGLATAESLRYIAIDFAHVENLDYSGAIAFLDIRDMLQEAGITVLFTGLNQKVRPKLIQEGVLSSLKEGHMNEFVNLDFASEYVETMMLDRAAFVRGYWLMFDSFRKLHTQALLKATYEIFEAVLGAEVGNRLWRYAEQQQFRAGDFLCREGHFNHTLYLLQRGAVTTFAAKGGGDLAAMHAKLLLGSSSDRGAVGAGEVRLAVSGGRRDSSEMTGGSWGGGSGSKIKTKTKTKRAIRQQRELERQATQIKRKHTMGRGAFVNEECLFRDDPVQHSTIADEDCVVWAISRQSMKELEAHDPHLAAAILRNILRVSSAVRERLEREVSAIESFHNTVDAEGGGKSNLRLLSSGARDSGFGLFGGTAAGGGGSGSGTGAGGDTLSSKSLGTRVLQEIRDMHEHRANNAKDVDLIEDTLHVTGAAHSHHFHHMAIDEAIRTSVDGYQGMASSIRAGQGEKGISTSHSSRGSLSPRSPVAAAARAGSAPRHKRRFGEASPDWHDVRPHLSAAQRQDAIDCFLVHSVLQRTNTAHPDILPELILAGVAPHLVHAVAQRRAAAGDEGGAEEDGESKKVALGGGTLGATGTSARHERRDGGESLPDNAEAYRQRRCTIDVLHELKRPKSFRELGTNAEMEVGEVEAYELSLLESIMRESGDAKAIAQKFASVTSGKRSPVMTTSDGDRLQTAAEASSTATLDNSNNNKKKTGASPPSPKRNIKLGHDHRRISLEELQRAVMDLGFFPSAAEVRDMHATLGPHHHLRVGSAAFEDGADLDEFLEMITVLSLKRMTHRQLEGLHSLFVLYADKKTGTKLSREALEKLMKSLNHPEDEIELEFLMREWDLENLGFLDFDAFVSIVSHVLKSEELDQQVERDFLTLCGETNVLNPSKQQQRSAVVAADVVRTARALGVPVDHDLAEEMVFDADEDGTSQLTLDELIATIEHVHIDETIDDDDEGGGCATGANSGWFEPISPDGRSSSGLHYAPDQHPRSTVGLAADDDNNSEMSRRNSDNENAGGSSSLEGAADGVERRSPSSAALRKHGMAERRQSRIEMRRKPDATED